MLVDLGLRHARTLETNQSFPVGHTEARWLERGGASKDVDYAASPPLAYYPFAEANIGTPITRDVDYTNRSIRVFVPISSQMTRQSLRTFDGYVTALDVTSICFAPVITNFSLDTSSNSLRLWADANLTDMGRLTEEFTFGLISSHQLSGLYSNITCTLHKYILNTTLPGMEWMVYMCSLGVGSFAFVNLSYPDVESALLQSYPADWWKVPDISSLPVRRDGSWTTLSYRNVPFSWAISICSTKLTSSYQHLSFRADKILQDRNLTFDEDLKDVDTKDLLHWLGAKSTTETAESRGIFSIDPKTDWNDPLVGQLDPGTPYAIEAPLGGNVMGPSHLNWITTYRPCAWCPADFQGNLSYFHPVHTAVIQKTLQTT